MLLSTFGVNCQIIQDWVIMDSRASSSFLRHGSLVIKQQIADVPITMIQSDGDTMMSMYGNNRNLPQLTRATMVCHILSIFQTSLLSGVTYLV